jgi:hypothetical protein
MARVLRLLVVEFSGLRMEAPVNRIARRSKVVLVGLVLAAFAATMVQGKPDYTKKEKTSCTTCHIKPGSKDLNDLGKCYEKKKSLDGCKVEPKK